MFIRGVMRRWKSKDHLQVRVSSSRCSRVLLGVKPRNSISPYDQSSHVQKWQLWFVSVENQRIFENLARCAVDLDICNAMRCACERRRHDMDLWRAKLSTDHQLKLEAQFQGIQGGAADVDFQGALPLESRGFGGFSNERSRWEFVRTARSKQINGSSHVSLRKK